MLDTGNLFNLTTTPDIPEWSSKTFEIDWENNRLLTRRIDGKEAVAQAAEIALLVEYLEHEIFSDKFGSEIKKFIGKDKDLFKCNAERLVKEALAPDLRINRIYNFKFEDINPREIHLIFTIETNVGETVEIDHEVAL